MTILLTKSFKSIERVPVQCTITVHEFDPDGLRSYNLEEGRVWHIIVIRDLISLSVVLLIKSGILITTKVYQRRILTINYLSFTNFDGIIFSYFSKFCKINTCIV